MSYDRRNPTAFDVAPNFPPSAMTRCSLRRIVRTSIFASLILATSTSNAQELGTSQPKPEPPGSAGQRETGGGVRRDRGTLTELLKNYQRDDDDSTEGMLDDARERLEQSPLDLGDAYRDFDIDDLDLDLDAMRADGFDLDELLEELRNDLDSDSPDDGDADADGDDGLIEAAEALPETAAGRFVLPRLAATDISTDRVGDGVRPRSFRQDSGVPAGGLPESAVQRPGPWTPLVRTWAAPNTWSHPRYFEDRMLERHGHERWGYAQPLVSGARFFATVPMLPYLSTISPPCDCEYTLGYYRSGDCAPAVYQRPPRDRRAILAESAFMAGAIAILP